MPLSSKIRTYVRQNVLGLVAIFIALSGTAYATHPGGANTISSGDIIDEEVRSVDLKNGEVKNDDLGVNSVGSAKIADRSVKNADLSIGASSSNTIADGGIQGVDVANETLTGSHVDDGSLGSGELADAAVTEQKLADGAVTASKLGCEGNSPDDEMVKVGSVCVDRYENSLWDAPTGGNQITGPIPCDANGQDCTDIYARSVAGIQPYTRGITYFQAQQALANSGKRLPTNAEWQMAVAGTPDSTDCNVNTGVPQNTGANPSCISNHGIFDMVGNLWEWVADWDEDAAGCENWPSPQFGGDLTCVGRMDGDASNHLPGALIRGGDNDSDSGAGPFAIAATAFPGGSGSGIALDVVGFRGAR